MRTYEKRPPAVQQATAPQQAQQAVPSSAGNQAMLAMLGIQNQSGDTRFSEALRAKFAPKPMPQAERSQPMALSPDILQKAEERYQTPLAGLKAYEDTGLLDSGYNGYAQGNEIHIDGSLAPAKREEVLMHEIGHVVQRGSGMAHGSGLLDNPALEQQADQGFAAPQSFSVPTSAVGPVMGSGKGKGHGKGKGKKARSQPAIDLAPSLQVIDVEPIIPDLPPSLQVIDEEPMIPDLPPLSQEEISLLVHQKPKETKQHGQKGKFVGSPSGYHIHTDIAKEHYKSTMHNRRIDLNSSAKRIEALREICDICKTTTEHGAKECYLWLLAECLGNDQEIPGDLIIRTLFPSS